MPFVPLEAAVAISGNPPVVGSDVPTIDFTTVGRIWIKVMRLPSAGMVIEQHMDPIDHATLVAAGSVRAWTGNKRPMDYHAPAIIEIPAGTPHAFWALVPDTVLCCIGDAEKMLAAAGEKDELVDVFDRVVGEVETVITPSGEAVQVRHPPPVEGR